MGRLTLLGQSSRPDRDLNLPLTPHHLEGEWIAHIGLFDPLKQISGGDHPVLGNRNHQVPPLESRELSRALGKHLLDQGAIALGKL